MSVPMQTLRQNEKRCLLLTTQESKRHDSQDVQALLQTYTFALMLARIQHHYHSTDPTTFGFYFETSFEKNPMMLECRFPSCTITRISKGSRLRTEPYSLHLLQRLQNHSKVLGEPILQWHKRYTGKKNSQNVQACAFNPNLRPHGPSHLMPQILPQNLRHLVSTEMLV